MAFGGRAHNLNMAYSCMSNRREAWAIEYITSQWLLMAYYGFARPIRLEDFIPSCRANFLE